MSPSSNGFRTLGSQPRNIGSIPVGDTKILTVQRSSRITVIRTVLSSEIECSSPHWNANFSSNLLVNTQYRKCYANG